MQTQPPEPTLIIGIVSDTHIPDRVDRLHPQLLARLAEQRVELILHAGDIAIPRVLKELAQVAPVKAVRGNRDLAGFSSVPWQTSLMLAGHKISLAHGHGSFTSYLWDKIQTLLFGYNFDRYRAILSAQLPDADIIIFGHTHRPVIHKIGVQLFFNPGSVSIREPKNQLPTFGVLKFFSDGFFEAEIIELEEYLLVGHHWELISKENKS
jgi:putative phosphoesterase